MCSQLPTLMAPSSNYKYFIKVFLVKNVSVLGMLALKYINAMKIKYTPLAAGYTFSTKVLMMESRILTGISTI